MNSKKQKNKKVPGILHLFNISNAVSVQAKVQKVVILMVSLSMLVLGIVSCWLNYSSTMATLEQSMNETSDIAASRVEWQITAYKNVIQELGRTARLSNDSYTIEQKQEIIDEKVNNYNFIRGKLINTDGIAEIDGTDYSERNYFIRALKGETNISEPLVAKTDGKISLIVAAPVWEGGVPDTEVVGVVFFSIDPNTLNDILKSINVSKNSGAYIINGSGTTVAHTTDGMVESQNNTIENAKTDSKLAGIAAIEKKMVAGESGYDTYHYGGKTKLISYAPIAGADNWSIAINAPTSDFIGDTVIGIIITIVIAIFFIILASTLSVKIGKSIGDPIKECSTRINLLLEGDLTSPVPVITTKDEVHILAESTTGIVDGLRSIIEDIKYLLGSMAKGDLTVISPIHDKYIGDYAEILQSLANIKRNLSDTMISIREASEQVSAGSTQMAASAQTLAEGATDQAGAVEELTATVEAVTTTAEQSAGEAQVLYDDVLKSAKEAQDGGTAMSDLTQAMERINTTSREIADIIETIEDIASQTNLLSLNASIEAARAGESGRGFAVVADQIGKLAANSAQSAVDTKELINKALSEVEKGNSITERTVEVFNHVVESMQEFAKSTQVSKENSESQAEMLKQVEAGIEQISQVVQDDSAAAEETSATSEELSAQAEHLQNMIEQFKIEE